MSLQDVVEACTVCFYNDRPLSKRPCCSKPVCLPCMQRWVTKCRREQQEQQRAESMQAQGVRTDPQSSRRSQQQRQHQGQAPSASGSGSAGGQESAFVATCPNCRQEIHLEGKATVKEDQYLTGVRDQLSTLSPILQGSYARDCTVCELCGNKALSLALLRSRSWTGPLCSACYEQNQSEIVPVEDVPNMLRKRIQDRLDFLMNLQKSLATSSEDGVADLPARLLGQRHQFLVDRQRVKSALQASATRTMAEFESLLKQRQREVDRACDQSLRKVQDETNNVQLRLNVIKGRMRELIAHPSAASTLTKSQLDAKRAALKAEMEQELSRISNISSQEPTARVPCPAPLSPAVPQLPDVRLPTHTISFVRTMSTVLSRRDQCVITPGRPTMPHTGLLGRRGVNWQSPMQAPRFNTGGEWTSVLAAEPKEEEAEAIRIEESDSQQHSQRHAIQVNSNSGGGSAQIAPHISRNDGIQNIDRDKHDADAEEKRPSAKSEGDDDDNDDEDEEDSKPLISLVTSHSRRLKAASVNRVHSAKRRGSEASSVQGLPPKAAAVASHNNDDNAQQGPQGSSSSANATDTSNGRVRSSSSSRSSHAADHNVSSEKAHASPAKPTSRRRRPRLKDYDDFDEEDVPLDRHGKPIANETMLHALLKRSSNRFDTLARIFPGVNESFWQKYEGKHKVKFPQRVIDLAANQATRRVLMYNTDDETLLATTECPCDGDEVAEHEYHYPMNKKATEAQIYAHFSNSRETSSSAAHHS